MAQGPRGADGMSAAGDAWGSALTDVAVAHRSWTLDQQIRLTQTPAPTGNESARARLVQLALRRAGASTVRLDAAGNVCVVLGEGTRPPLVCMAHLDAVYEDGAPMDLVPVHRDGPVIRAPGIGDNGRGLAALLTLARLLRAPELAARLTRPVHLVATVGEEGDGNLRGARAWFDDAARQGMTPHAVIAIDGPGDESIVHHAVGSHRLRVTLHGEGGHSWVQADAANPIHALGGFIAAAARLGNVRSRDAVVHVTRMHGGESLTAIPQQAWVEIDVRGTSSARIEQVRHDLRRLVAWHTLPGLRAEVTVLGDRPAGTLDAAHPLVEAAAHATARVGCTPRSAVASTDANVPLARGIPAIAVGAGGRGGGAHSRHEWYDDAHGARGIERLLRLVLLQAAG
ncbi:MAG: M20/M25/M40 family metallo-hydrolase [Gemmatimonas sp.]|uniref:M20/M25/M40 family metallo-hydrolase n=1 Tax=Gemmatimonas sp. TaxID=1962908 RepID=UPI0025C27136|nr:M20/M25/M40 family metallo-hydrolase [Gemmatimonas sp.]MCE2953150.1 M20/M25/M40 family metallo-hydrolase [Gemmatimonas sp.]